MNRIQKIILCVAVGLIVLLGVFLPYHDGYRFFMAQNWGARLDWHRMLIPMTLVVCVAGLAIFLTKDTDWPSDKSRCLTLPAINWLALVKPAFILTVCAIGFVCIVSVDGRSSFFDEPGRPDNEIMAPPPWEQVADAASRNFPDLDQNYVRQIYEHARNTKIARERYSNWEPPPVHSVAEAIPYVSWARNWRLGRETNLAKKRVATGNAPQADYDLVAQSERMQVICENGNENQQIWRTGRNTFSTMIAIIFLAYLFVKWLRLWGKS